MYDQLIAQDWDKGLAGSGKVDWGVAARYEGYGPEIAESYQIPEIGTWVFQIRKGVHYALDSANEASRLVNGRELTADDVVWNIRRLHTDPAYPNAAPRYSQPAMSKSVTAEKTGPWEVTLKVPVDSWTGFFWVAYGGCSENMYAREVVEKYGNAEDWTRLVGTGPFMVTDYVSQSVGTFKRNPNWYKTDPAGPGKGNRVPYIDGYKLLVIPDTSTRLAVMRTGKADWVTQIQSEDARSLLKTNPKMQYKRYLTGASTTGTGGILGVYMRGEKAELPFKDKRVRQALTMSIDYDAIKRDLYAGDGETIVWPVAPTVDWLYTPLEKLPETVQVLYKYNPERAKQLLAEAGYPKGFKTKMMVQNISTQMDPAAVVKAMWAKVGVDLEIQPRETAVYNAANTARSWEEMSLRGIGTDSLTSLFDMSPMRSVVEQINDPRSEEAHLEMQKYIFINMPKADQIFRELVPYQMEQAFVVPLPGVYTYTLWQPWVKNHYGENTMGLWPPYAWIDQDLKEQMTGRK